MGYREEWDMEARTSVETRETAPPTCAVETQSLEEFLKLLKACGSEVQPLAQPKVYLQPQLEKSFRGPGLPQLAKRSVRTFFTAGECEVSFQKVSSEHPEAPGNYEWDEARKAQLRVFNEILSELVAFIFTHDLEIPIQVETVVHRTESRLKRFGLDRHW
jgi:hypothetical protein